MTGIFTWLLSWFLGRGPTPRGPAAPVPVVPTPAPPPIGPPPVDPATQVVRLVNLVRTRHGLDPLATSPALMAACQRHAGLMAARGELSHQFPGEPSPGERDTQAGYIWSREAENAAAGQATPAAVVAAWQADAPHLANILGPYVATGVGVATDPRGVRYWVQDFGAPAR